MNKFQIGQKVVVRIKNEAGNHEFYGVVTELDQYAPDRCAVTVRGEYRGQIGDWCGPAHEVFPVAE